MRKSGHGRLEAEANAAGIGRLDGGHPVLERFRGGALVPIEGELHVVGGDGLTIVELRALAQDEVVGEPVLGRRPRLGEARSLRVARHRLEHRVVKRVEEHVRRDDARRLGGVEPGGRDRHVDGPGELPFRGGRRGRGAERSQEQQRDDQGERNPSGHGEPPLHRKRNGSEPRDDTRSAPIISGRVGLSIRSPGPPTVDLGLRRSRCRSPSNRSSRSARGRCAASACSTSPGWWPATC